MKRLAFFFSLVVLIGFWPPACKSQVTVSGSGATKVVPNDPTTGTILYGLAKIATTGAIRTTPADANLPAWVVIGGAGTSQTIPAVMAVTGDVPCIMDTTASNTRGMLVVVSPTNNQQCHAIPVTTPPSTGYAIGIMADNATTSGQTALVSAQLINFQPGSGAGTGSVTSVGLSMPSEFSVAGSPITGSGVLTVTKATQAANTVWAGPASGAAAAAGFRALQTADLPAGTSGSCGGDSTGTYPSCVVLQASGTFGLPGDVSVTLTGNSNDYNGCTGSVCRMSSSADVPVTGLNPSAGLVTGASMDGRILPVCNVGTSRITLVDETNSTASSPANRFQFGANVTLRPKACKLLIYDANAATLRWRLLDSAPLDAYAVRTCDIPWGSIDPNAPVISATDDVVTTCLNNTGFDWRITAVSVYTNAGAPILHPVLTGQGANSIMTTDCIPASPGVLKSCAINTTPILVHSLAPDGATCSTPPCSLDGAQTADGVAQYMYIHVVGILQ